MSQADNTRVPPDREQITGLVLAGGRGSRMGGVDKGLQPLDGLPLALHALQLLTPQVGGTAINANRHLVQYAAFGVPVWPDVLPDYPGPLAGLITGLRHCPTPWLISVPCDCPRFPADLVQRLVDALVRDGAELAVAATREGADVRLQPVFMLLPTTLADDLDAQVRDGERKVARWLARHRVATAVFDDGDAFANANTAEELAQFSRR